MPDETASAARILVQCLKYVTKVGRKPETASTAVSEAKTLDPPLQGAHWLASQCRSAGMQHAA